MLTLDGMCEIIRGKRRIEKPYGSRGFITDLCWRYGFMFPNPNQRYRFQVEDDWRR